MLGSGFDVLRGALDVARLTVDAILRVDLVRVRVTVSVRVRVRVRVSVPRATSRTLHTAPTHALTHARTHLQPLLAPLLLDILVHPCGAEALLGPVVDGQIARDLIRARVRV